MRFESIFKSKTDNLNQEDTLKYDNEITLQENKQTSLLT